MPAPISIWVLRVPSQLGAGLAPVFHHLLRQVERDHYCRETRDILDALINRLTRENRELLPLIERLDRAA